jgi:trehalose 6-phosphate synthase
VWTRLEPAILKAILDGLLANDSLVFQTAADARAFLATVGAHLPGAIIDQGRGTATYSDAVTRVWANGISVDDEELMAEAATPEFARYRYLMRPGTGTRMILRVDRLDPTKNVIRGFEAYARLLEAHPELRERVQFVALLVPSKSTIAIYQRYQEEAQALAEAVNRSHGTRSWKPIRLIYEHNRVQALAAMSLYDVLLVNPVADGMNLVAKEGPTLNPHFGVLVLSKRAGAYEELSAGALGIDPEDIEGTAEALWEALTMPAVERRERAEAIRRVIRNHDLRDWFTALLEDIDEHAPVPSSISAA